MRKALLILLVVLPVAMQAQWVAKKSPTLGYLEAVPASYNADTTARYPCILFLHGSGERGNGTSDVWKVKNAGLPKQITSASKLCIGSECFIVLAPQTNSWAWRTKKTINGVQVTINDANKFMKWALLNYRIDPRRVYITGLSMGGEGTWFALADSAEMYAAGAPVCGRASRTEGGKIAKVGVPVWAFHGDEDTSIEFEGDWNAIGGYRAYNKSVKRPAHTNIKFSTYTGVGHNCWDRAYNLTNTYHSPNVYQWMLQKRKP